MMDEEIIIDITHSQMDWTCLKNKEQMAEDFQKAYEAVETMQDLERNAKE
jgi:hypothetical protein